MTELEGTWVLVRFDWFGEIRPASVASAVLRMEGDHFSLKSGDHTYASGTVRVDASVRPKRAFFTQHLGPDFSAAQAGVYELEGDELRLRLSDNEVAPEGFENDKGLAVYRRQTLA